MKRKLILLSVFLSYFGFSISAQANHFIGGEISYTSISPGIIIAEFTGYFDCQATPPPASLPLNIKSPGCSNGQTVTASLQAGNTRKLDPYCTSVGNSCSGTGLINFQEARYLATITLPAQCPEWVLSFQDCVKPPVTNLVSSGVNCFYIEAYINTAVSQPMSPQFYPMPTYMVTVNSPASILNLAAKRGTEDSLVYTLKPALVNLNTPPVYKPNFSFANFIPSAIPVQLHPQTGLLTFLPNVHNQVMGYDANAYTFVVEATSYKKLNGIMTKISSTQRNMQVLVENVAPNQNPDINNITANGLPVQPNDIIEVQAGDPLIFQFETFDGNTSDSVSVVRQDPAKPYMPWSVTFSASNSNFPTGTFTWGTNNATVGDLFYFPITVKDNVCPVRGVTTRMFGVKITSRTTGVRKSDMANIVFTAYPNPFFEEVYFRIQGKEKAQSIAIYNLLGQKTDEFKVNEAMGSEQKISWANAAKNAPGTYIAKLISENRTVQTLKFTKL